MPFLLRTITRIEEQQSILEKSGFEDLSSFMDYPGGRLVTLQRGRTVTRLELNGRAFYLKRNRFNWREFVKTILNFGWPQRNAVTEWQNISAFEKVGIPTVKPIAMGEKRFLGVELASFILTEELYGAKPLEKLIEAELAGELSLAKRIWKHSLIRQVAQLARRMHTSGMCHQDFYLGHFFWSHNDTLYLIDLQRVLRRSKLSRRFIVKDLGQLNYSADCVGNISRTDRMRFFLHYLDVQSLGAGEKILAKSINAKTERIARHTVKLLERRRRRREIP